VCVGVCVCMYVCVALRISLDGICLLSERCLRVIVLHTGGLGH